MSESSGLFIRFFKRYTLVDVFSLILLLDIIQLLVYSLYYYNIEFMVYGLMVIFSI